MHELERMKHLIETYPEEFPESSERADGGSPGGTDEDEQDHGRRILDNLQKSGRRRGRSSAPNPEN